MSIATAQTSPPRPARKDRRAKRERVLIAAVDAVYSNYCSNSVFELDAAVVELIGRPVDRDND